MRYKFTFEFDTTRELSRNEARQLCLNAHSDIKREMEYIPLPFININVKSNVEEVLNSNDIWREEHNELQEEMSVDETMEGNTPNG